MPRKRKTNQTVLIVGEGSIDEAFLKHLKSLYITRHCGVSVRVINAHGGSPESIVDFTIRQKNSASFDRVIVVMDTDVEWPQATINKARKHKIKLIGTNPCIEGLMLAALDKPVPNSNSDCKNRVQGIIKNDLTDQRSYQEFFTKESIDAKSETVQSLNEIISSFQLQE